MFLQDMPRSRRHLKPAPAALQKRPRQEEKRKQWTNASMLAAMEAARQGTLSINKAAILHGVPKTTLKVVG